MNTAVIIGSGNIASAFGKRMSEIGMEVLQVIGRNEETTNALAEELDATPTVELKEIDETADIYLIAVDDDSIRLVAEACQHLDGLVVHTSGSTQVEAIPNAKRGVIWPLRSITKDEDLYWDDMNLIIESDLESVFEYAERLGAHCHKLTGLQREKAHMVAVILNNFVNHLIHMADELSDEAGVSRALFDDLLESTITKAESSLAKDLQTGPARRGDNGIVDRHMALLESHSDFKKIYELMSQSIMNTHNVN